MPTAESSARPPSVLDIDAQQVGTLYAKALLGATENAGQTENVLAEFDALVTGVLDRHPKFESVLASGVVPADDLVGVLDKAFSGKVSQLFLNFLKVLARHGRLNALRAVHVAAKELYNKLRGRVVVRVTSATELNGRLTEHIANTVRGRLKLEPVLEHRVNPDLIGGVVLQVGDTVYDGSVATQFARLRTRLLDRSVHEIQSGRDRFSSPGGD